jgi:hypothetical protein
LKEKPKELTRRGGWLLLSEQLQQEQSSMLKTKTHFDQVPLDTILKIVGTVSQPAAPPGPLLTPDKKILAKHPKLRRTGGR